MNALHRKARQLTCLSAGLFTLWFSLFWMLDAKPSLFWSISSIGLCTILALSGLTWLCAIADTRTDSRASKIACLSGGLFALWYGFFGFLGATSLVWSFPGWLLLGVCLTSAYLWSCAKAPGWPQRSARRLYQVGQEQGPKLISALVLVITGVLFTLGKLLQAIGEANVGGGIYEYTEDNESFNEQNEILGSCSDFYSNYASSSTVTSDYYDYYRGPYRDPWSNE